MRKTDQIDAEKLAQSQFVLNRTPTYVQEEVYQHLRDLSRFYQNLTEDIVRTQNRLHKVLQVTFPEMRKNVVSHFDELKTAERQGAKANALETAREMIIDGLPDDKIAKYSKLSPKEITQLRQELSLAGV